MCSPESPPDLNSDEIIFLRENEDEMKRLAGLCEVQKHGMEDLEVSEINLLQALIGFKCWFKC